MADNADDDAPEIRRRAVFAGPGGKRPWALLGFLKTHCILKPHRVSFYDRERFAVPVTAATTRTTLGQENYSHGV